MIGFKLFHVIATLMFILGISPAAAAIDRFAAGDAAFLKRADFAQARTALTVYREAYARTPDSEAGWRLAMGCYFYGLRFVKEDDEKKIIFREGRDAGLAAAKETPNCAACHFWAAINMALYGQTVGVFKMFFSLGDIRDHLKESVRIDPTYANAGAYRLLGLIEQKLPGILGGSDDRARDYFEKAISTSPGEPLNYLFLSNLYKDAFDDQAKALSAAKRGLGVPPPSADRIESLEALVTLRESAQNLERRKP
jgi:hypothetical protein